MCSQEITLINSLQLTNMDFVRENSEGHNLVIDESPAPKENISWCADDDDSFCFDNFDCQNQDDENDLHSTDRPAAFAFDLDDEEETNMNSADDSKANEKSSEADRRHDDQNREEAAEQGNYHDMFKGLVVSLNGNIGSGKTTFLRYLSEKGVSVCEEPIQDFRKLPSAPDTNPLNMLYENESILTTVIVEMYLHFAQIDCGLNHLRKLRNSKEPVVVIERMRKYDLFIHFLESRLTPDQWKIVRHIFLDITTSIIPSIDGMVVFDTSPSDCLQRIEARGRSEESTISLDFLQTFHNKLIANYTADRAKGTPVLVLNNTDCTLEENFQKLKTFVKRIWKKKTRKIRVTGNH